jgi:hypothetical protein
MALKPTDGIPAEAGITRAAGSQSAKAGRPFPHRPAHGCSFRFGALPFSRNLLGLLESGQAAYFDSYSGGSNTDSYTKSVRDADGHDDDSGQSNDEDAVHFCGGYVDEDPLADKLSHVYVAIAKPNEHAGPDRRVNIVHQHYKRERYQNPSARARRASTDSHRKRRCDPFPRSLRLQGDRVPERRRPVARLLLGRLPPVERPAPTREPARDTGLGADRRRYGSDGRDSSRAGRLRSGRSGWPPSRQLCAVWLPADVKLELHPAGKSAGGRRPRGQSDDGRHRARLCDVFNRSASILTRAQSSWSARQGAALRITSTAPRLPTSMCRWVRRRSSWRTPTISPSATRWRLSGGSVGSGSQ